MFPGFFRICSANGRCQNPYGTGRLRELNVLLDEGQNIPRWAGPGNSVHLQTLAHQCHRRNGGNAEPRGCSRQLFGVYLHHENSACGLGCDLLQFRRDHFAWPAPFRPEIDQHRQPRLAYQSFKVLISLQVNTLGRMRKRRLAVAALRVFVERPVLKPIALPAGWTAHQNSFFVQC